MQAEFLGSVFQHTPSNETEAAIVKSLLKSNTLGGSPCLCVQMGIRLGRQARSIFFRHNDVDNLESILRDVSRSRGPASSGSPRGNVFVAVESVYSMDGDLAPLAEILDACDRCGAEVILDEAHG